MYKSITKGKIMKCMKCGREQLEGAKFCDTCGASLQGADILEKNSETGNGQLSVAEKHSNTGSASKLKFILSVAGIAILVDVLLIFGIGFFALLTDDDVGDDVSPAIESYIDENKEDYIDEYKPQMEEYINKRVEKYLDENLERMVEDEVDKYWY